MSAITHFTHVRNFRKSKSTKNTKKVDAKPGLGMMDIISEVSMIEYHKKLIFLIRSLRSRLNIETTIFFHHEGCIQ